MRRNPLLLMAVGTMLAHMAVWTDPSTASEAVRNVWVQVAPPGIGIVRALTMAAVCPEVRFDNGVVPMTERAAPNSGFTIRLCEATVPPGTHAIAVAGKHLRPPPVRPRRIAVVGDTGCRLKAGAALDDGFQACNDPDDWEFAKVASQVAAWQPDLIIHVGDYLYREQACPTGNTGCEGSPFNSPGMRWTTWEADYFRPAAPMLEAAPLVFVRGDHEQCERAGPGFFRFLDPFPPRGCLDFTAPYTINFTDLQLIVMDTVQAGDTSLSPEVVRARYQEDFRTVAQLAAGHAWLLSHRPIWGVRPTKEDGSAVEFLNVTVQEALREALGALPPQIELVLTGHIHLGEVLSFRSGRPPQMVVGTGGTLLLPEVTQDIIGSKIDGELVSHATIVSTHGFVTFEPWGHHAWTIGVRNAIGAKVTNCRLADKSVICPTD
jgi:Calcineurin-like phosphoesterase